MTLAGRRYIVCRNLDQMTRDAADRATICSFDLCYLEQDSCRQSADFAVKRFFIRAGRADT